eukprot:91910_1
MIFFFVLFTSISDCIYIIYISFYTHTITFVSVISLKFIYILIDFTHRQKHKNILVIYLFIYIYMFIHITIIYRLYICLKLSGLPSCCKLTSKVFTEKPPA